MLKSRATASPGDLGTDIVPRASSQGRINWSKPENNVAWCKIAAQSVVASEYTKLGDSVYAWLDK